MFEAADVSRAARTANGRRRRLSRAVPLLICVLALALRLWAPGPTTETVDEDLWLHRSQTFGTSIAHGDFGQATAIGVLPERVEHPTMPGVTTMWAGTIGRALATATGEIGLSEPVDVASPQSPQVLRAGRAVVSLLTVIGLFVVMAALTRLFGRPVAWLTGAVLATEPWLVGHGGLLHTDALVTLFGAAAVFGAAVAVPNARLHAHGLPASYLSEWEATRLAQRRAAMWVVVSAVCAAMALLTKANALGIVAPGITVVIVDSVVRSVRARRRTGIVTNFDAATAMRLVRFGIIWLGITAVVCVVLWPAMWTDPGTQLSGVWNTVSQAELPRPKFFHGTVTTSPGPSFYVVTLAFRLTPWALVLVVAGLVATVLRGVAWTTRRRTWFDSLPEIPAWVLLSIVPYVVVFARSPNKYDRYGMPVVPFLLVAGAITAVHIARLVIARSPSLEARRPRAAAAAIAMVALVGVSLMTAARAPYALDYASPMLGGQHAAEQWIPLGWGESAAELGATVTRLEDGECADISVANLWRLPVAVPCGRAIEPGGVESLAAADYAVTLVALRQRGSFPWYREWLVANATLVDTVTIDGVTYSELWKIPEASQN